LQFATKIAVVLRDNLAVWQKANVTAFAFCGIASHDEANRAAVAAVSAADLDLVGIAMRGERRLIDKVLDRLRPHP
jgi:hypothetical protein